MGINRAILLGNIGQTPNYSITTSGHQILKFSMATSERYKAKGGDYVEVTTWHNVRVWGRHAEYLSDKIDKGSQVFVEGSFRQDKWDTLSGETKWFSYVLAQQVVVLNRGSGKSTTDHSVERNNPQPQQGSLDVGQPTAPVPSDDDIPF